MLERFGEIEKQPVALVGCRRRRQRRTLQPLDGVLQFAPVTVDASGEGCRPVRLGGAPVQIPESVRGIPVGGLILDDPRVSAIA